MEKTLRALFGQGRLDAFAPELKGAAQDALQLFVFDRLHKIGARPKAISRLDVGWVT